MMGMSEMPVVYIAVNQVNSKRYVGVTRKTIQQRRYDHIWTALSPRSKRKSVFSHAIKKHGPDAFLFSSLGEYDSYADALAAERAFIGKMKPEYNVSAGGVGPNGTKWSKERHAHMAVALRAAWTEERKQSLSALFKSRPLTAAHRARLKAIYKPEDHYTAVVCLDDGKWFQSIKAAATHYGIANPGRISAAAIGREITANGLHFAYSDKPITQVERSDLLKERADRRVAYRRRVKLARSRPVICVSDGKAYPSGTAAALTYNISPIRIVQLCRNGGQTLSGLRFMYADAEAPVQPRVRTSEEIADADARRDAGRKRGVAKRCKPVICLDDGTSYASCSDAASAHGLAHASVWNAITYNDGRIAGRTFKFVERQQS